nr:zf-HC2 domain-containing protein [uncultured Dysosmobacter sp.]
MKIHENAALLDAFVDGELTAAEMAEVQAHLAECPGCQAYVDDALAIRADFPTAESTELPADFTDHIMQAVAKTPQSRPKTQPWGKLAAAAACLAVIVLVQYGAGLSSRNTSNEAAAYTADCAAAESTVERSADASSGDDADSCQPMDPADDSGESDSVAAGSGEPDSVAADSTQQANKSESTDGTASIQSAYQNGKSAVPVITGADLPTVRVSATEIGDLLDDRTPTEQKDTGVVRYLLTRTEFDALAEELADRGVTLETEDTDSSQLWLEVCGE